MTNLSPKIEIINHFDRLINRVDIDIEKGLEKYNNDQVLGDLECLKSFQNKSRIVKFGLNLSINSDNTLRENILQKEDSWPESTKVVDYLNQVRAKTIEELRKAQENALEFCNSSHFDFTNQQIDINEMRSQIFGEKFYFQVFHNQSQPEEWIFSLFTFITDFYMSPSDIGILEKMINDNENYTYPSNMFSQEENIVLDEKMVLNGLCRNYFSDNLKFLKFPNHVIHVSKEDIFKVNAIFAIIEISRINLTSSSIGLTNLQRLSFIGESQKLDEIKLENLPSLNYLRLNFKSLEMILLRNLFALRELELSSSSQLNTEILTKIFDISCNLERFYITDIHKNIIYYGKKELILSQILNESIHYKLLMNLCNNLNKLCLNFTNLDDENINKLLDGQLRFRQVSAFSIDSSKITRLEKKLFEGFPMLKDLKINDLSRNHIQSVDKRHFAELTQLEFLNLSGNELESIEENMFSNLANLQILNLSNNRLEKLSPQSLVGLRNLKGLNLENNKLNYFDLNILDNINKIEGIILTGNPISNEDEILKRFY